MEKEIRKEGRNDSGMFLWCKICIINSMECIHFKYNHSEHYRYAWLGMNRYLTIAKVFNNSIHSLGYDLIQQDSLNQLYCWNLCITINHHTTGNGINTSICCHVSSFFLHSLCYLLIEITFRHIE